MQNDPVNSQHICNWTNEQLDLLGRKRLYEEIRRLNDELQRVYRNYGKRCAKQEKLEQEIKRLSSKGYFTCLD